MLSQIFLMLFVDGMPGQIDKLYRYRTGLWPVKCYLKLIVRGYREKRYSYVRAIFQFSNTRD